MLIGFCVRRTTVAGVFMPFIATAPILVRAGSA